MLSNKTQLLLHRMVEMAYTSQVSFKHCAVLLQGHKVMHMAVNSNQVCMDVKTPTKHAEHSVMRNLEQKYRFIRVQVSNQIKPDYFCDSSFESR